MKLTCQILFALTALSNTSIAQTVAVTTDGWNSPSYDASMLDARSQLQGIAIGIHNSTMRPEIAGVVSEVHVIDGQWVDQGTVIVSLHDGVAHAAWKSAHAQASKQGRVKAAEIELQLAQRQLDRLRQAYKESASSMFELEEKQSQVEQTRAALTVEQEEANAAQANLELRAAELAKFHLRAPFEGLVVRLDKKQGQPIAADEPAFLIVDARQLEVEMFLPLAIFGKITEGNEYTMAAQAPVGRTLQAQARYVAKHIDPTSSTFRCVFTIDNQDLSLPSGFAVTLQLSQSSY